MISGRLALPAGQRALDRLGVGDLPGRWLDHAYQRLGSRLGVEGRAEDFGGQIEIDAAWPPGDRGMDSARDSDSDVFGPIDAVCRFRIRLGRVHLIELFVVALLEIDDRPVARPADLDHREAVGGRVCQCDHAVKKAGSGDRQANTGLSGQVAGDRGRVSGGLFVTKADVSNALGLSQPGQVRYRDPRHAEDRVESVELHGIDHQMEAVGDRGGIRFV